MAALRDSPRHGEWLIVPLPDRGSGKATNPAVAPAASAGIRTWVVYPERREKAPIVIVIHEIFGLTDWVRAVADRLAAEGFIAVAPDLLSGMGPGGGGTDSFQGDDARAAIRRLGPDEVCRRLDAVREGALRLPSAAPRTACVGFCWGGSQSFVYSTAQPGLGAAVVYYGTGPPDTESLSKLACPVLGLYGGDDARVTSTVQGTAGALAGLKKTFEPHVYEGAGHGFLRQQSGRDGANLEAARQAWAATIEFLRRHLE
jgi:carboxymethylenebutenolidase